MYLALRLGNMSCITTLVFREDNKNFEVLDLDTMEKFKESSAFILDHKKEFFGCEELNNLTYLALHSYEEYLILNETVEVEICPRYLVKGFLINIIQDGRIAQVRTWLMLIRITDCMIVLDKPEFTFIVDNRFSVTVRVKDKQRFNALIAKVSMGVVV